MVGKNQYQAGIKGVAFRVREIRVGCDEGLIKIVARTVAIEIGLLRIRKVTLGDENGRFGGAFASHR